MTVVLVISDLHLSPVPPASRIDDYQAAIFKKLAQCSDLIRSVHVDALIILGDIFHLKTAVKTPYWLTLKFVDWLKEVNSLGCRIGIVVGNHDVPYGNVDFINRQPIGVVMALPFVEQELRFEDSGLRIVCLDFNPSFIRDSLILERGDEKFLMVCAHQCLMPSGQFYDEPTVNFGEVNLNIDVLAYGHIHSPAIIEKVGQTLFVNPGALSRGSIHKDNLEREVSVVLLKFDESVQFKKIDLEVAPAEDVFSVEVHQEEKDRDSEIEGFVEVLRSTIGETASSDPLAVLMGMPCSDNVKAIARLYLDGDQISVETL